MRLGIRNLLELHPGWSVCAEANNGQEAVEKTLQFHPDVIIMDITMPVMNGLEAASEITRKQPDIPVILFSLHLSDDLLPPLQNRRNSWSCSQRRCRARSGAGSGNSIGWRDFLSRSKNHFKLNQMGLAGL